LHDHCIPLEHTSLTKSFDNPTLLSWSALQQASANTDRVLLVVVANGVILLTLELVALTSSQGGSVIELSLVQMYDRLGDMPFFCSRMV